MCLFTTYVDPHVMLLCRYVWVPCISVLHCVQYVPLPFSSGWCGTAYLRDPHPLPQWMTRTFTTDLTQGPVERWMRRRKERPWTCSILICLTLSCTMKQEQGEQKGTSQTVRTAQGIHHIQASPGVMESKPSCAIPMPVLANLKFMSVHCVINTNWWC